MMPCRTPFPLLLATAALLAGSAALAAQEPAFSPSPQDTPPGAAVTRDTTGAGTRAPAFRLPFRVGGQATMTSDLYQSHGIAARRPGSAWRMNLSPQATMFGGITMGIDVILSSEQSEFRQNINQLGLNPRWSWGGAHIGDFTRDYSDFTVQGVRVRGLGFDANPGIFRFSVQGGRLQRTTTGGLDGPVYRRNMVAMNTGVGHEMSSHLNLTVLGARDELRTEDALLVMDTILVDTMHADLRPRVDTRPQENLAMGLDGQLLLFQRAFTLRGALAASLFTRDLLADTIDISGSNGPAADALTRTLSGVYRTRLSTSADYAYQLDGTLSVRATRLRGGFEHIGPGYTSMGLPYLVNDRKSYHVNATTRTRDGRVSVQAQARHQKNNLLSQKLNTVDRNIGNLTVSTRLTETLSFSFTGLVTTLSNDAPGDSARLDTRSYALNTNTALRRDIFGLPGVLSLAYGVQHTADGNPLALIPGVTSHTVATSVQVTIAPSLTVAPTLSGVLTQGEGMDRQENVLLGFRGNARFLDGNLRTMANLNHTVNQGRQISGFQFRANYPVGWGTDLSFQARHTRFSAFGERPAFQESFATTSISRSF
jgi:hypothetical protein